MKGRFALHAWSLRGRSQAALSGRQWHGQVTDCQRLSERSMNNPKPPPRGSCSENGLPQGKTTKPEPPARSCVFFLVLGASPSWRVLAGDPRRVTRQPPAAQGRGAPGSTGTGVCSAPCTVGEGSRAPGHSHPGFHGKNSVSKRTVTHIGSGEGSAEWGPARVGDTHNSSQTIVPDPLSTTLPFRGCSVQNVLLKPSKMLINLL